MESVENLKKLCEEKDKEIARLKSIVDRMKQLLFEENETSSHSSSLVLCSPPATERLFAPTRTSSAHKSPILGSSSVRVRKRLEYDFQNAQDVRKSSSLFTPNNPSLMKTVERDPDETFWEEAEAKPSAQKKFESSYDRLPAAKKPAYAYKSKSLRGKKRKQLPGRSCNNCQEYYEAAGVSCKACSRHRAEHPRTNTPAGYWDLDFPSTQELRARQAATPSPEK